MKATRLLIIKLFQFLWLFLLVNQVAFSQELSPPSGKPTQKMTLLFYAKLSNPIHRLTLNNDLSILAASELNETSEHIAYVWSTKDGSLKNRFIVPDRHAYLQLSPNGKYLLASASRNSNGPSTIWEVDSGTIVNQFDWLYGYGISPDSRVLYEFDQSSGLIKFYEFPRMTLMEDIPAYCGAIAFSNDGRLLAADGCKELSKFGEWDNRGVPVKRSESVGIWERNVYKKIREIDVRSKKSVFHYLAISPDDKLIASWHRNGIDIYKIEDGRLNISIKDKDNQFRFGTFAFAENGKYLIAVYNKDRKLGYKVDFQMKVWNVADGTVVAHFREKGEKKYKPPSHGSYSQRLGIFTYKKVGNTVSFWRFDDSTELVQEQSVKPLVTPVVMEVRENSQ